MRRSGRSFILVWLGQMVVIALSIQGAISRAYGADLCKETSFEFHNDLIWISISTSKQAEKLTFLLDTGASVSVIDRKLCEKLNVKGGNKVAVQGIGGPTEGIWPVKLPAVFEGEPLPSKFLSLDLTDLSNSSGRKVDGILGADFFSGRIIRVNYQTRTIQILNPVDFHPPSHATSIALKRKKGVFLVPITINKSNHTWVRLDSGCNSSLHWVNTGAAFNPSDSALTIAGVGETKSETTKVVARIGGHESVVETVLHRKPLFSGERGLLGNGYLSKFIVTLNAKTAHLYLESYSYPPSLAFVH